MKTRVLIVLFGLLVAATVQARMYQWSDPHSGTTYLSGVPPAWYRSDVTGPRVVVFEKGKVVDDTAVQANLLKQKLLRQQALRELEQRKEEEARREQERLLAEQSLNAEPEPTADEETGEQDVMSVFRSIVQEWDRMSGGQPPPMNLPK